MDAWWSWMSSLSGGLDLVTRVTALLGLGALMTWGFRRRAASTRHLLWTTTFVLLIALPFAVHGLPTLELIILPSSSPAPWVEGAVLTEATATPGLIRNVTVQGLMWVWAMGSLAALLSLAVGWGRFALWARRGRPVREAAWLNDVNGLRRRLRVWQSVRLIESPRAHTAMVGGVFRPTILLPMSARTWTAERRMTVLTHELIHIRRFDVLRQLLCSVALALYWFHPLSWLAARRAAMSREQACDEGVLQLGAQPSAYARHLLELATHPDAEPGALALPLVQRSQLERRVMEILDPKRPGPSWLFATILCTLLIVCGLATAVSQPMSSADSYAKSCPGPNPLPD